KRARLVPGELAAQIVIDQLVFDSCDLLERGRILEEGFFDGSLLLLARRTEQISNRCLVVFRAFNHETSQRSCVSTLFHALVDSILQILPNPVGSDTQGTEGDSQLSRELGASRDPLGSVRLIVEGNEPQALGRKLRQTMGEAVKAFGGFVSFQMTLSRSIS